MSRNIRRFLPWLVLVVGCTSQPFCEFTDFSPIYHLQMPDKYWGGDGMGKAMVYARFEDPDNDFQEADFVSMSSGEGTQVVTFRLAIDGELNTNRTQHRPGLLNNICDRSQAAELDDNCFERNPGIALGFRTHWGSDQRSCLVVGMKGAARDPALGFWCADRGTGNRRPSRDILELPGSAHVYAMDQILEPEEYLFVGTNNGLYVINGETDSYEDDGVTWDGHESLPSRRDGIRDVSLLATTDEDDVEGGFLIALGYPSQRLVLVGEFLPDDPETEHLDETLVPRACVEVDEIGFGSIARLARLSPEGGPVLLAGADQQEAERFDGVHIFELDLSEDPEDVECEETTPWETLVCGLLEDDQGVECDIPGSGFGSSIAVGNLDDTDEYEVVVGCPNATVDGVARGGAAYVFRPGRQADGIAPLAVVRHSDPRIDDRFGLGVLVAPIGDRDELIITSPKRNQAYLSLCTGVGDQAPLWDSPLSTTNSWEDMRCRDPAH